MTDHFENKPFVKAQDALPKTYDPVGTESRWQRIWQESGAFHPDVNDQGEPFSIVIPPPNVTGSLHMGHAFNTALIDTIVRFQRLQGKNVLCLPGTDHASIAVQTILEKQLKEEGLTREQLGREAFLKRAWAWKSESGGRIVDQLRRLGYSVDWQRERFTLDPGLSQAVSEAFIRLHKKGLIYRGEYLVNWCPASGSAVSDLEVEMKEVDGYLWYFQYPISDSSLAGQTSHLEVATTRPETMLGDVAVAVNPSDERYKHLVGQKLIVPFVEREIPVIADEHVDKNFGTGCVKVTPAHDPNDFAIGQRHDLPQITVMNKDGTMNDMAGPFKGLDRFDARKAVIEGLKKKKLLTRIDTYRHSVPYSDRGKVPVEPLLSTQWFVRMEPMADRCRAHLSKGEPHFIPARWEKVYRDWLSGIRDWCISRQLWWGHRIPAWFDKEENVYVGKTEDEVRKKYDLKDIELHQDEDVLDTWFSSALWTFSTLGWPKQDNLLSRYHPTSVLVTGFDIIFFWVARMIMMTTHFISEVPFKKILIHGLIKDSEGIKMSKSKGNTLDPLDIIDGINLSDLSAKRTEGLMQPQMKERIKKQTKKDFPEGINAYGTDALRLTFCSLATGGRDINFDMKRVEGYRNFCNKLWNASRFIEMQIESYGVSEELNEDLTEKWINYKFNLTVKKVNDAFDSFRFDLATKAIYEFIWYEFCDWYIELSKIKLSKESEDNSKIVKSMVNLLEETLRLAHPIMPFITEEIWMQFKPFHQNLEESIMIAKAPKHKKNLSDEEYQAIEWLKEIVSGIRNIRGEMLIKPSVMIKAFYEGGNKTDKKRSADLTSLIKEIAGLESLEWMKEGEELPPSAVVVLENLKILIPLEGLIDPKEESQRLRKKIDKASKEHKMLSSKLENKKFTDNAPKELVQEQQERFELISKELSNLNDQLKEISRLL